MYPSIIGGNLTETSGYRWHSLVPVDCEIEISDIDENIAYWLDEWDITMA
jgi:hypothetical protein